MTKDDMVTVKIQFTVSKSSVDNRTGNTPEASIESGLEQLLAVLFDDDTDGYGGVVPRTALVGEFKIISITNIKEFSEPLFSIHTVEGKGGFYAIGSNKPKFCFHSKSIAGASRKAADAISSYHKFLNTGAIS